MKSKNLQELLGDIEIENPQDITNPVIKKIVYDSRKIEPDSLFVAIKGFTTDGHNYLADAEKKGAVAAIVEERNNHIHIPQLIVKNSRKELAKIGAKFYSPEIQNMTIIGITGTNGKTTTSILVRSIMEKAGIRTGLIGTIFYDMANKQIKAWNTTPESIDIYEMLYTMYSCSQKGCVLEVSSHALRLNRVDCIQFKEGLFTNLTQDHLDFHKDIEDYYSAKKELFTHLSEKGKAIINIEDLYGQRLYNEIQQEIITYGFNSNADIYPIHFESTINGSSIIIYTHSGEIEIKSPLIGSFNIENILASVAAGIGLEYDINTIKKGIESVKRIPGRLEPIKTIENKTVILDYAHTPDALEKAITVLKKLSPANLWVVFGCGGNRDKTKRPVMGKIAQNLADKIIITSDNPRFEEPDQIIEQIMQGISNTKNNVYKISDRKAAIKYSIDHSTNGDIILIAGKGHEDYQDVKGVKHPFDDRKIILEFIQ